MAEAMCRACCLLLYCTHRVDALDAVVEVAEADSGNVACRGLGAALWLLLLACALKGKSCLGETVVLVLLPACTCDLLVVLGKVIAQQLLAAVLLLAARGASLLLAGCVNALAAALMARSTAGSCLEAGCSSITFHAASVISGQHERCVASASSPSSGTRAPAAASCWQLPGEAVSCRAAVARALLSAAAAAALSSGASCAACSAMASLVGTLVSWMMLQAKDAIVS